MVRLVFRPYTRVGRAICTSAPLRASTRVSSGFALLRHSSPSFGSQRNCSRWDLQLTIVCPLKRLVFKARFHCALGFNHPLTRSCARLLGPCFKTGRNASITVVLDAYADPSAPTGPKSTSWSTRQISPSRECTQRVEHAGASDCDAFRFPHNGFRFFSLSFQSAFQLSLTVLVRYRSPTSI